jgi:muramoyltetrapeptide carboxypeptidase LdcA involved in peptidoglycan recycling
MVPLTQVVTKTSSHTFNYSHLRQVRDMKVDIEILFKIRFSQTLFQTNFQRISTVWSKQSWHARDQTTQRKSRIFSSFLKLQNLDSSRCLVKISASCLSVLTWLRAISSLASWSLKKWWRMSICFVREWLTGLFASFMALSLSHKSGIWEKWHP